MSRPHDSNDLSRCTPWFQKMKCAVVIHDLHGIILWSNNYADEIYKAPMRGLQVYNIVASKYRDLARFRVVATIRDGFMPGDIEIEYRASDGSPFWLKTTSTLANWGTRRCVLTIAENKTVEHWLLLFIYNLVHGVLSSREWEFLQLRAQNYSHGQIAKKWNSTIGSVSNYPGKIKAKLKIDKDGYLKLIEHIYLTEFYNN